MEERFIEDYSSYILERIPTHPDWSEAIAITTLSSILSTVRFWTVLDRVRLNVFFLNIGPSGIAHKTLPMKAIMRPTLKEMEDILGERIVFPESFTMEAIVKEMNGGHNSGVCIADEYTGFLKAAYHKDYMNEMTEFLSRAYDGHIPSRSTIKRELEEVEQCHFSLITATTPYVYSVMRPDLFIQGTGNRFMYIITDEVKEKKFDYEELFPDERRKEIIDERIYEFANKLMTLKRTIETGSVITAARDAGQRLSEFRSELIARARESYNKDKTTFNHSYYVRAFENTLKLSAIKTISDKYVLFPSQGKSSFVLMLDSVEWAISQTEKYLQYFIKLMEQWRASYTKMLPVETLDLHLERMITLLKDHEGKLSYTELKSVMKMQPNKFLDVMELLTASGKIEVYKEEQIGAGRPKQMVKLVDMQKT